VISPAEARARVLSCLRFAVLDHRRRREWDRGRDVGALYLWPILGWATLSDVSTTLRPSWHAGLSFIA
jgi:hypothetical protein